MIVALVIFCLFLTVLLVIGRRRRRHGVEQRELKQSVHRAERAEQKRGG